MTEKPARAVNSESASLRVTGGVAFAKASTVELGQQLSRISMRASVEVHTECGKRNGMAHDLVVICKIIKHTQRAGEEIVIAQSPKGEARRAP